MSRVEEENAFSIPMKETILAACVEISSHPSFSRRTVSGSAAAETLGSIGAPEGSNPRI